MQDNKKDINSLSKEIIDRGIAVFETKDKFQLWLDVEIRALGMKKPIDCSEDEILTILGRIDHGVYS